MRKMLHPFVSPKIERGIRDLYDWAACAGEPLLQNFRFPAKPLPDHLAAVAFYCAVHEGFRKAQSLLLELISERQGSADPRVHQEEWTFRKLADTMAWQILHGQIYLGRRLFRSEAPPSLRHSNLESVIGVAEEMHGRDLGKFALLSDLTSFVQVGDLLLSEPLEGRATVVEVKDGSKNEKIVAFVESWYVDRSPDELKQFERLEGAKAAEQAKRVARQLARLKHFNDVANSGEGIDPDTNEPVRVPSETFNLARYDDELSATIARAKQNDWATAVVEECFFIAAYANRMRPVSDHVFRTWLKADEAWQAGYPLVDLMEGMLTPLAIPIFIRDLPADQKFDLLCGRVHVKMGLHLDRFIELSRKLGVAMRWSSRKHAAAMRRDQGSLLLDNRMLIAERGDAELTIFDGVVTRIFFEGVRPSAFVGVLNATLTEMQHMHDVPGDGG